MSKHSVSLTSAIVYGADFTPRSSSLLSRVHSANANPLSRVEQLKRKFISTQLTSLRNQIYATLRQAGSTHAMALAEVDRALREVMLATQKASDIATAEAAWADGARLSQKEQPHDN